MRTSNSSRRRPSSTSSSTALARNHESAEILSDVMAAGEQRLKEADRRGGGKLGFVYTSGTWVHGSSKERCGDLDPVGTSEDAKTKPPRLVAWRPQMERDVLSARDILDTVVVRPGPCHLGVLRARSGGRQKW